MTPHCEKKLTGWNRKASQKDPGKEEMTLTPIVCYLFHFSLCQIKKLNRSPVLIEKNFLSCLSNLLYEGTGVEEHIHPLSGTPSPISP